MTTEIEHNGMIICTNEIISPESLLNLCVKEETNSQFKSKVNTSSHHPFSLLVVSERNRLEIKEDDLLILRACKGCSVFEFISRVGKWGKFSIPKEVISTLDIKNYDLIQFNIVREAKSCDKLEDNLIDLSQIDKNKKTLFRTNEFVTLFEKGRTPITLPRYLKVTPDLLELCYLIHGDGHYGYKFYFVNKSCELHEFVISKFEEIFKISRSTWRARLLFNHQSNKEQAKERWKTLLGLKEEQFYPTISKSQLNTSEDGNLRIGIDVPVVADIFRHVFNKLQNLKGTDSLHALNGLLCAEGGARKNQHGLHKITLSFSQKEKAMFQEILNETGVSKIASISQNSRFVISGWEKLYSFFRLFLDNGVIPFNLHSIRRGKAISGFLDHSFTKTAYKYLKLLSKRPSFTIKDLTIITGYLPNSIITTIRRKQYSAFANLSGKGVNRNPFKISITSEGREFISIVEELNAYQNGQQN